MGWQGLRTHATGNTTNAALQVQYVQQIKHLYPGAFSLQYIRVPVDKT